MLTVDDRLTVINPSSVGYFEHPCAEEILNFNFALNWQPET
jgi:hypothetical protein